MITVIYRSESALVARERIERDFEEKSEISLRSFIKPILRVIGRNLYQSVLRRSCYNVDVKYEHVIRAVLINFLLNHGEMAFITITLINQRLI